VHLQLWPQRGGALATMLLLATWVGTACAPAAAPTTSAPAATTAPAAPKPTTAAAAPAQPTTAPAAAAAPTQPAAAAKPTTGAPAPVAGPAQTGGTVTIPIGADPTLNPWHPNAFVESVFVNRVLFDGLTKPGKDLAPAPDLASSWEAAPDGLSWTFKLHPDARWSDGQAITADDVAFTFNDIVLKKDLGATGAGNFSAVQSVEAVDPTTVKFTLSRQFGALPSNLAYNAGILPRHAFDGQGDPWALNSFNKGTPISSGPFKVDSYASGQSVNLSRNDAYFGGKPNLDKLVFKVVPDANTQIAQALSGELSIMIMDNKAAVDRVKSAAQVRVEPRQLVQYYWLALNQTDPRFQDVRVRQAFDYAIDRQAIITAVEKGYGKPANSAIVPALKAYYDPSHEAQYTFSVDRAKQLLSDAGWQPGPDGILQKDGQPFQFTMDVGQRGVLQPTNELIQQNLKAVGIQADLNSMEWNAYIQKVVVKRDYTATVNWWVYPNDPDVYAYFHSSAAGKGFNIPGFQDPKLDDLLTKVQTDSDLTQRKQDVTDLQSFMADNLPYIFLWYPEEIDVINANLQGVPDLNLRDNMHYVAEWWLKK
jgi:peptide/nickel transport system substrate-binding protein